MLVAIGIPEAVPILVGGTMLYFRRFVEEESERERMENSETERSTIVRKDDSLLGLIFSFDGASSMTL